jgi:hypothetical protein
LERASAAIRASPTARSAQSRLINKRLTGNTIYVTVRPRCARHLFDNRGRGLADPAGNARCRRLEVDDGGATFTQAQPVPRIDSGRSRARRSCRAFGSSRGATALAIDPTHSGRDLRFRLQRRHLAFDRYGATWTQIHAVTNTGAHASEFSVATHADGHTRMYSDEGDSRLAPTASVFRSAVRRSSPAPGVCPEDQQQRCGSGLRNLQFLHWPMLV